MTTAADPRPVRVTWVIKGLGPGGAERLLVEAARARSGIEAAAIYALRSKGHLAPALAESGVAVRGLDVATLRDPRWLWRLARSVRATRPDVVHVHSPALAGYVRLAARTGLFGWPRPGVVTTEHNAWPTYRRLTRWTNALTAPLDDLTVAVSNEVRSSLPRRVRERVVVVRHGIDLDAVRSMAGHRAAIRDELGIRPDDVVVATVANYRPQKNYPNLLAAAALVVAAEPRARFVAVGQGPQSGAIEDLHRSLRLDDRFILTGYRSDAVAVLSAADVFVLASDYEGLPVALMEALALGLPVVATAVGGVAETIDPTAGRLVPPRDARALAEALTSLIADEELRRRLAAGAASLGDTFAAARAAEVLERSYRDVRAGRSRARSRTTASH